MHFDPSAQANISSEHGGKQREDSSEASSQSFSQSSRYDLGMHFDPSAQANWSKEQDRESEFAVASLSFTTLGWMLRIQIVRRNCKGVKCIIFYDNTHSQQFQRVLRTM